MECAAYEHRPTPCRLHLVTSDPQLCSAEVEHDDEYEILDRIEQLKDDSGPVIYALERDGRWG
jgi:Fe-S-cluster containining protein